MKSTPPLTTALRVGLAAVALGTILSASAAAAGSRDRSIGESSTTQFDILSSNAKSAFRVFVHVPDGKIPSAGYPVLYVTDGNMSCPLAIATSNSLSPQIAAKPVIICIGYPTTDNMVILKRRLHDLTDKARTIPSALQWGGLETSGGADAFGEFIQFELRPIIEKRFPVDPKHVALFGHSLGGWFSLHMYLKHPEWFTTFIAGSPSVWWNRPELDYDLQALAARNIKTPPLLMEVGSLEQQPGEEPIVNVNAYRMIDNFKTYARALGASKLSGIKTHVIDGETHSSALNPELDHAIRFAFPQASP